MSKQVVVLSAEAYQKLGDFLTQLPYRQAAPVINFLNSETTIEEREEEEQADDLDNDAEGSGDNS